MSAALRNGGTVPPPPPPIEYIKKIVLPKMGHPLSEQRAMSMMEEHELYTILKIVGY